MSRPLWIAAGGCLLAALVLTLLGVGDQAGALPNWQALVLGVVQGATELLPISSSGHLILVPWLADWDYLREHDAFNQTFDVSLHLGTLVAVGRYFRRDIVRLAVAWLGTLGRAGSRRPTSASRGSWPWRPCRPPRRRARGGRDRRSAGRAVADRDPAGLRRGPLDRRPAAGGARYGGPRAPVGGRGRAGAVPFADARRLAFRDHDHRRAAFSSTGTRQPGSRSCSSCRSRSAPFFKGVTDVLLADLPPGRGAVPRRQPRVGRHRPAGDLGASRLRAPPRLHAVRRLPAHSRRSGAADRERGAIGRLLRAGQSVQLDITPIIVHGTTSRESGCSLDTDV